MLGTVIKKAVFWIVICLPLMASFCGESAFNGGGKPADTPTSIDTFTVTGDGVVGTDGLEVIDGSGVFLLSWDVISSSTYTYVVSLSANDELGSNDKIFFGGTCGVALSCNASGDFECSFDPAAKTIACGGGSAIDVANILTGPSPQSVYVFLSATNEMMSSTGSASQQVKFVFP